MLKRNISVLVITAVVWLASACTGGKNATTASPDQGGFRITPGDRIELDLTDLVELGFSSDLSITLKLPSEDYKTTKTLLDLTEFIVNTPSEDNHYKIILPKDIAGIRPMVLLIEAPSLRAQFTDIIYADTVAGRPGIASSLAYDLLKYYPGKTFSSFRSSDFTGIKNLIQTQIDQVKSETEQLSLASVRFDRVMRFYKNTLAFNPTFLTAIQPFGIQYNFSLVAPDGINASDTPEGNLNNYKFAGNFMVNGSPAAYNPFNQTNNPARMSTATPGLGMSISALEGNRVNLSANAIDPDDDFIDKSFIISYTPRKLPRNLPPGIDPANLPKAEPVSSYEVKSNLGKPDDPAVYKSDLIGYNEAINKINYKKGLLGNTACDIDDSDTDCGETAFKDIYLLVTDGMVRVPYRWNFKYIDINRAPKVIADQNNRINDTTLDDKTIAQIPGATSAFPFGAIATVDGAAVAGAFRQHASHCETDSNILEQNIRAKADGPWGCVFRSYDPDLDDDPNAATDTYYYTVANYEPSTEIMTNGQKISPSTAGPKTVTGAVLDTCVDNNGISHYKCGLALYSITVDNSVKIAAASKASLEYSYDVIITDRPSNGFQASKTISRKIKFTPIPPRFVNFDARTKPGTLSDIGKTYSASDQAGNPSNIEGTYARNDIFIDEVLANAKASTPNASNVGFKETIFDIINRPAFHFTSNGVNGDQSPYLTQPRRVGGNGLTFDVDGELTAFNPVIPRLMGNALRSAAPSPAPTTPGARNFYTPGGDVITDFDPITNDTFDAVTYSYPREYDKTCSLDSNNAELDGSGNPIWDQRSIRTDTMVWQEGGWVAELDVVDLDNLDLRPSEPYEPVYLSLAHDAVNFGIQGIISFCDPETPNPDTLTYQTYEATTDINGINYTKKDAERCKSWMPTAPQQLQPVAVYYEGRKDDGSLVNRKMVYHRLRLRWQPKDHELVTNFIKNHLTSFLVYGDRYRTLSNKNELEAMQDRMVYPSVELVAARKNHKPCVTFGQASYPARYPVVHDANTSVNDFIFNVKDENRTGENGNSTALSGRYQAEVFPNAANTGTLKAIDQIDFARFVPFIENCTSLDSSAVGDPLPLVWYAGADKLPRTRLTSRLSNAPVSNYPFCMRLKYSAYKEPVSGGRVFDKVALFQSTGPATVNLAAFTEGGKACFTQSSFTFSANDQYALLATPCTSISYSSGGVTGVILSNMDPTLPANGSFPAGTDLRFKFIPRFYGTDYGLNLSTFHFDAAGIDTFVFDTTSGLNQMIPVRDEVVPTTGQYDHLSLAVNTSVTPGNLGEIPPPLPGMPADGLFTYVDWDHQPSQMVLPTGTPAPTNVFYRVNPSGILQVFTKGTASASVPVKVTNVITGTGIPTGGLESDPFDIVQYPDALLTPQPGFNNANSDPTFSAPAGRSSCIDAPTGSAAGYLNGILTGALSYSSLDPYRKCNLNWAPTSNDVGKVYQYQFLVQDNYGATADVNNNRTAYGIGAVHPNASGATSTFYIPNDSWTSTHGPLSYFFVRLESIEDNLAPYFVNAAGTTNSAKYCTAVSTATGCTGSTPDAAWTTIFGGSGTQPSTCSAGSGFTCPGTNPGEKVRDGDTILSTSPVTLTEGTSGTISVLVRDDNVTPALKNVAAQPPRKVLVVKKYVSAGDPGWVKTYTVNSFTTMALGVTNSTLGDSKTATQFSFDWKPTDEEAYQLSNADGFLIPFVVSDQDYIPQPDPSFPSSFNVQKITRTIWVWANIRVRNNSPIITYIGTSGETPLSGATLTFETGKTSTYTIRIKDTDRARYDIGSELTGFTATSSSKPSFLNNPPGSLGSLTSSGAYLYQEFTISNSSLTPSDIGMYTYDLNIADPGDPSKCWVEGDISSCVDSTRASTPISAVSFNIQVVGKPYFLVPHTDANPALNRNTANVFVNSTSNPTVLNYPLALSISKDAEKGQTFFFGISGASSATVPMRTTVPPTSTPVPATAKGMYVNENSVLKWPDASFDMVGTTYDVPLYGIADIYCGSGTDVTLYRFNEALNAVETCKVSNANMTNNAASEHLFLKVNNNYDVPPLGSLTAVTATRTTTHAAASAAAAKAEASAQYAAFKGRCPTCTSIPSSSGASPSGLALNPSTTNGQVSFALNNYPNDFLFSYDGSSTLSVTRTYGDNLPTNTSRATNFTVMKGDTAQFSATLSSAPSLRTHYRWYVNGCLKKAGDVSSTTVTYDLPISILMSGLNNDCTGEYSIAETNSGKLGSLRVRLNIVNNIENTTATSDGATKTYVWNVSVLNNKPNLQAGIPLTSTQYNGNMPVSLAMPVSYGAKSYLAYVDPSSSLGAAFRMYEIQGDGCMSETGYAARSPITSQPTTLGVHTSPSLMMAMNNTTTYPTSSSEAATTFKTTSRSYGASISGSSLASWNVAQAYNDVAAYSVFSQFTVSTLASTYFQTSSGVYDSSTSSNFYLMDGQDGYGYRSARQYWQNDITAVGSSIYGTSAGANAKPAAMVTSTSSSVRRNIMTGTGSSSILFQLIGAKNSSANGAASAINILSMYTSGNNLRGTLIKTISFSGSAAAPNCVVDGTPLDGTYIAANDTLYVLVYGNGGTGKVVAISNATNSSASCTILGDVANPSLNATEFNANISKIAVDPVTNFIYGVINRTAAKGSQIYFIDAYAGKVYTQDLSSTINPAALIYSKEQNAVLILDGDKSSTKTPTLYKIW